MFHGETRESKAKVYITVEGKKVTAQYILTLSDIKESNENVVNSLQAKLDAALKLTAKIYSAPVKNTVDMEDNNKNTDENDIIIHSNKDSISSLYLSPEEDSSDKESNSEM